MKSLIVVFVCAAILVGSFPAQTRRTGRHAIELIEVGAFHGDEIDAKTGDRYLGLFHASDGYVLEESSIRVRLVNDPIVDDEKSRTGKEVGLQGKSREAPLFLVRGISQLRPGPVKTVFSKEMMLDRNADVSLSLDRKSYHLRVVSKENPPNADNIVTFDSKLLLSLGSESQELYALSGQADQPGFPLLWAGDLDGDGKLDLLILASDHDNSHDLRLFLSSSASRGRLVKEVAVFHTNGC